MAEEIVLEKGEVKSLPERKHSAFTPLVARTDDLVGTGEELLVVTPGKTGLKLLPYGSIFHGYDPEFEIPIFETPEGIFTDWHEPKPVETEAPKVEGEAP